MKKPLIAIVGPTASGKTDLAIALAQLFQGEVISADSRTIYKEFLIGTASPCLNKQTQLIDPQRGGYLIEKVPHYCLHFLSPTQIFTVAQFQKMAFQLIQEIQQRKKIPFLVGGSGLYLDAVTKGLLIPRVPPNFHLRRKLEKMSNKQLTDVLKKLDPESAAQIDPQNKRRLIRALEVCLASGTPFSKLRRKKEPPYQVLTIGLKLKKEILKQRINERVEMMMKMGFIEEVQNLLSKYPPNSPAFTALGYQQIVKWLISNKKQEPTELVSQIKQATWQFARRQMSWFKRDQTIHWVNNKEEAEKLIRVFLEPV